jgi:two-component system response regulator FixJ
VCPRSRSRRRDKLGSDSNALIHSRIVYVVDDDESVRDSLRALLESYKMIVRDYASADLFLAEVEQPTTGCLVLDLHMQGLTGLGLLRRLRAQGSSLPVIVMTGRGDSSLKENVAQAGAFAFLEKPMTDTVLLSTIENAFRALRLDVADDT